MDSEKYIKELWPGERRWVDLQPHLKSRGYLLRRRYQPDWSPAKKMKEDDECGISDPAESNIDVVRASDGQHMFLKRIGSSTHEFTCHMKLSSSSKSSRYTPNILDTILLPDTDESVFIVMPILRIFTSPLFENGYELMESILQLTEERIFAWKPNNLCLYIVFFQALAAAHSERIYHGDIISRNIAMFADGMFYKGWHVFDTYNYHPGDITKSKSPLKTAPYVPRCLAPARYVLIDFGNSNYFPGEAMALELRRHGSYIPPEMTGTKLFDCFKVDVWCFGKLIQDLFARILRLTSIPTVDEIQVYPHLSLWMEKMLRENPAKRPTIQELLDELRGILKSIPDESLQQPIRIKKYWSYGETIQAVEAILRGHGDEEILFAQLRNAEPRRKQLNFAEGTMKERVELLGRVYRFLRNKGQEGGTMAWISSRKEPKK